MSQALPPGTIAAQRTNTAGVCADAVGPGMPGPGAACYSCPQGYGQPYLRTFDVADRGVFYCSPVTEQGPAETITERVFPKAGFGPSREVWAGVFGFVGGAVIVTMLTRIGGR